MFTEMKTWMDRRTSGAQGARRMINTTDRLIVGKEISGQIWTKGFTGNPVFDRGIEYESPYENDFNILKKNLLLKYFQEKKSSGTLPFVLDLGGGDGTGIRSLVPQGFVNRGLTVNLSDMRSSQQVQFDRKNYLDLIPGNILHRKTWDGIEKWMQKNTQGTNFDVIMARPGRAYEVTEDYVEVAKVYSQLLIRSLNLLTHKNGIFIATIPWHTLLLNDYSEEYLSELGLTTIRRYLHHLGEYPGITWKLKEDNSHIKASSIMANPFGGGPLTWAGGVLMISKNADEPFDIVP